MLLIHVMDLNMANLIRQAVSNVLSVTVEDGAAEMTS